MNNQEIKETELREIREKFQKKTIYLLVAIVVLFLFAMWNPSKVVVIKKGFSMTIIVLSFILVGISFLGNHKENRKLLNINYQINDFTFMLIIAVLLVQVFTTFFFFPAPVEGESMANTLHDGDLVVMSVNKKVKRFDIVVMEVGEENNLSLNPELRLKDFLIKRVIGLPGDNLYFENGVLYINDHPVNKSFLETDEHSNENYPYALDKKKSNLTLAELVEYYPHFYRNLVLKNGKYYIPEDYYFIMGDNRGKSLDSSTGLGLFHKSQILGTPKYKVGFLYFRKLQ